MTTLPKTPTFNLSGKRALVTGGATGIGLGASVALAEAGASVTIAARRADVVEGAAEAIRSAGYEAQGLSLDITDLDAVADTFSDPFDIVVNSAGLARHSPATQTDPGDFDAVMSINLRGAYFLSSHAAKALMEAGKPGSIIHISSQMGHVGGLERAVYCASKWGVEGMVKAMAIEWGKKNVRINTICPTFIKTPLTEQTFSRPEMVEWVLSKIKLPRIGEVEDIMGAVLYLASDASAMVTGTSLLIDGGWTAD
ncbi:SDR family NAD(P)-dependent oxidoreductase [Primorskyibacter sp. S187A]|uniref:SDR family NAD(P)-dependent oxidoreductase n=1 Tax=Primorskyibacter sp. S187A TaxID=3415130 RepID=UPI003C7D9C0C